MNLKQALTVMPGLIFQLRCRLEPGRAGAERRAPGYAKQAPVALVVLDDCDALYRCLHEHAGCIAEVLGTKPPRSEAWLGRGVKASTTPDVALHHSQALARFILHQLPLLPDAELMRDIEHDILTRAHKAQAKYSETPPPERIDARCGACGKLTIDKHPPRHFGGDETWECSTCHKWHTETEILARRAARERELKAKTRRTA